MQLSFYDDLPVRYLCAVRLIRNKGWQISSRTTVVDARDKVRYKTIDNVPGNARKTANPLQIILEGYTKTSIYHDLGRMFGVKADTMSILSEYSMNGDCGHSLETPERLFAAHFGYAIYRYMLGGTAYPDVEYLNSLSKFDFRRFRI